MATKVNDQDELIIRMLEAEDERGIHLLFLHYQAFLNEVVFQLVHNRDAANDIIQDLFVYIWTNRHSLNIRRPLRYYLVRAVMNRVRNYQRDRSRLREVVVNDFWSLEHSSSVAPPDSALHVQDMKRLWRHARKKMKPRARVIFLLSRKRKMSYPQIAAHLGISVKAVEKNLSLALRILREVFGSYLNPVLLLSILF